MCTDHRNPKIIITHTVPTSVEPVNPIKRTMGVHNTFPISSAPLSSTAAVITFKTPGGIPAFSIPR
uniref:Uncharacterized protein n=1 Tax=Schistosoma curassoni TaxID=6186 RepID=A0A183JM90_9TREM